MRFISRSSHPPLQGKYEHRMCPENEVIRKGGGGKMVPLPINFSSVDRFHLIISGKSIEYLTDDQPRDWIPAFCVGGEKFYIPRFRYLIYFWNT